jgi:hypothetical protein
VTRGNLAQTLFAQRDFSGARAHQEAVLVARQRLFGDEHPAALAIRGNLARTLYAQGDLVGARAHLEVVLASSRRLLGDEHPDTLLVRDKLDTIMQALLAARP